VTSKLSIIALWAGIIGAVMADVSKEVHDLAEAKERISALTAERDEALKQGVLDAMGVFIEEEDKTPETVLVCLRLKWKARDDWEQFATEKIVQQKAEIERLKAQGGACA
jgi:uncharacterized small protein (DUF1192 family)